MPVAGLIKLTVHAQSDYLVGHPLENCQTTFPAHKTRKVKEIMTKVLKWFGNAAGLDVTEKDDF